MASTPTLTLIPVTPPTSTPLLPPPPLTTTPILPPITPVTPTSTTPTLVPTTTAVAPPVSTPATSTAVSTPVVTASSPTTSSAPSTAPPTSSTHSSSTTSLTSAVPSSTESIQVSTGSGGALITVTQVVPLQPTLAPASTSSTSTGTGKSKTFFQNKGEVAGVFSVVGIIGLGILFVLLTNSIRRRRAQKWDREIAEAAAEAAATAHAPVFDDEGYGPPGGPFGGYSDASSHGTYMQPPMAHGESYGMSEMHPYDAYAAAGAAGVGAGPVSRARSRRDIPNSTPGIAGYGGMGYEPGNGETQTPYPMFAGPGGPQPHEMYNAQPQYGAPQPQYDVRHRNDLEAAGLGAVSTLARGPSMQHPVQADLTRSTSQGAQSLFTTASLEHSPPPINESYAAHYQPGFRPEAEHLDPYGGFVEEQAGAEMPNTYIPEQQRAVTPDASDDDEEYEERGKRVLKVANE